MLSNLSVECVSGLWMNALCKNACNDMNDRANNESSRIREYFVLFDSLDGLNFLIMELQFLKDSKLNICKAHFILPGENKLSESAIRVERFSQILGLPTSVDIFNFKLEVITTNKITPVNPLSFKYPRDEVFLINSFKNKGEFTDRIRKANAQLLQLDRWICIPLCSPTQPHQLGEIRTISLAKLLEKKVYISNVVLTPSE